MINEEKNFDVIYVSFHSVQYHKNQRNFVCKHCVLARKNTQRTGNIFLIESRDWQQRRLAGKRVQIDRGMCHITFKTTVFPRPESYSAISHGKRPSVRCSLYLLSSTGIFLESRLPLSLSLSHFSPARLPAQPNAPFTSRNILPISLSMQISIRERQYLLNRNEKGFWCSDILSAIKSRASLTSGEKDTYCRKPCTFNEKQW